MTTEPQPAKTNAMSDNVTDLSKVIELPLDSLRSFEVVAEQFANLGILFSNTVVIQPSNATYLPEVGKLVLMGSPQHGLLEIRFTLPVVYFSCRLTSSQHATISAYDGDDEVLKVFETENANHQDSDPRVSSPPPNLPIAIQVQNIQRIVLQSVDGELVIHDVRFGF